MVRKEQSFVSRFKYDLIVLVLLGLVGTGMWLNRHPFTFDGEDDAVAGGEVPPQIGNGDVLLVVPDSSAGGGEFNDLDFSFAWYNALAQEVGPFALQVSGAFGPEDLVGIGLVIVPARASVLLEPPQIAVLRSWVEGGGSLVVEMPGPSWAALSGVKEPVLIGRSTKAITAAAGSLLQGDIGKHLLDTPLHSRMLRLDTVELPDVHRTDILLEIDGVPAHYHRAVGAGHVYVLGFDFGMAVTSLQQGVPLADFSVEPPEHLRDEGLDDDDDEPGMTRPDMLVAHPKLRQALVPYADLLERHVLYAPLRERPQARLWPYPETLAGALILTHEERGFGDRATYMAEYESRLGLSSTYFISPIEISNDALDALHAAGIEVGLGWHRNGPDAIYESRGLGRLRPYQVALTLAEQKERLESWSGRRVVSSRVHGLEWDADYTTTFRKLVAADVRIDSSYGPVEPESYGYLFGTGLPFFPIDRNGLPLPIYEMPYVLSDTAGFGADGTSVLATLLKESRGGYHNLLTLDIDADAMAHQPRPQTLETWMQALELARQEKHWVTNLREFVMFFDARRQASLRSRFDPDTRTLSLTADVPSVAAVRDGAPLPAPGLAVPLRYGSSIIESVTVDGRAIELNTLGRSGDGVLALISTSPGVRKVEVRYAAP